MADAEILHERLSATEGAVLQTDERIDDLEETVEEAVTDTITLQERILACLERLETRLETSNSSETEELRTRIAELEREQEQLEESVEDAQEEPEPLPIVETMDLEAEVIPEEVEPETESASGDESRKVTWWEKILTVR